MKKIRLGASELQVTDVCLGTMTFGEQNSEAEAHAQLDWALAHGINFVDTAEMYPIPPHRETQGRTEAIVGAWIGRNRPRRDDFVLASKIAGPGRRDWIRNGDTHVSKKTIPWAIDDSLKRLQTDWIDLYQIHWPERYVPGFGAWRFDPAQDRAAVSIAEQVEALAKAIKAGKIRAYGLSNETAYGLCEFARVAKELGAPPPASVQNGYSLVNRLFDGDLAEASHRAGIPLLAYSPLAMGLLTDKSRSGVFPKEGRLGRFADFGVRYKKPRVVEAMKRYAAIADRHGLSLAALALAFVRSRFFVASTIIGATSVAQLDEQAKYFDLALSTEALADIEAVNVEFSSPAAQ